MPQLSSAIKRINPSQTVALTGKVAALRAQGRSIIGLGAGEPDFPTPEHIANAAIEAIRAGKTRYTAPDGIAELKSAIADKFRRDNELTYAADEIIVGTGGKQILFNALLASLNVSDEVIIPAPYWVSYPDIVRFAGATPVIVPTKAPGFKLTPEALDAALTAKSRWLILNSPGNPTGAVYSADELAALLIVLDRHPEVMILSDDIYEHLIFGTTTFTTAPQLDPRLTKTRTLVLNGVSKSHAMTGWRIGFGAGPA